MEAADDSHFIRIYDHSFGIPNSVGLLKPPPPPPTYRQQPPLLPLPASHLRRSSSAVGHSYSPRTRRHSFTLKKSSQIPRKEEKKKKGPADSDSMFDSPPPSSLPLPSFTLRPKPVEASDDLRRLLRLQ